MCLACVFVAVAAAVEHPGPGGFDPSHPWGEGGGCEEALGGEGREGDGGGVGLVDGDGGRRREVRTDLAIWC